MKIADWKNINFLIGVLGSILLLMAWWMCSNIWPDNGEPFTYDQARDLLEIRELAAGRDVKLLGPTTSINGVHLGPAYFYALLPGFWWGNGDPQRILDWQVSLFFVSSLGLLIWGARNKDWPAMLTAIVVGAMPVTARMSHYFWNAHFMLISMIWFVWAWKIAVKKERLRWWVLVGITAGICMQMESALGIVVIGALIVRCVKNVTRLKGVVLGVALTLIPQVVFELTHKFQMSKLFLNEMTNGSVLGAKIGTWSELIVNRWNVLKEIVELSFSLPPVWVWPILALFVLLGWWVNRREKIGEVLLPGLIFVLAACLYLTYPYPLKHWYTYGLCVILIWWLWEWFVGVGIRKSFIMVGVLLALVLNVNGLVEISKFRSISKNLSDENKSSLINQIKVIKAASNSCGDSSYALYTLVPGIYDFSYQYLAWQMSEKGEIRTPDEMSYEPDEPAYIPDYQSLPWYKEKNEVQNVCVIVEKGTDDLYTKWEGTITPDCVGDTQIFPFGTRVEKRIEC